MQPSLFMCGIWAQFLSEKLTTHAIGDYFSVSVPFVHGVHVCANLCWIPFVWVYLGIPYSMSLVCREFVYYLNSKSWYVQLLETCRFCLIWVILWCRPTKVQESYCIPVIEANDSKLSLTDPFSIPFVIVPCFSFHHEIPGSKVDLFQVKWDVGVILRVFWEWVLSPSHKLYRICCLKVFLISGLSIHSKTRRI